MLAFDSGLLERSVGFLPGSASSSQVDLDCATKFYR